MSPYTTLKACDIFRRSLSVSGWAAVASKPLIHRPLHNALSSEPNHKTKSSRKQIESNTPQKITPRQYGNTELIMNAPKHKRSLRARRGLHGMNTALWLC